MRILSIIFLIGIMLLACKSTKPPKIDLSRLPELFNPDMPYSSNNDSIHTYGSLAKFMVDTIINDNPPYDSIYEWSVDPKKGEKISDIFGDEIIGIPLLSKVMKQFKMEESALIDNGVPVHNFLIRFVTMEDKWIVVSFFE